jgi:hypothetical protein
VPIANRIGLAVDREMICSFLHGINSPRVALNINFFGGLAVLLFAIPLIFNIGWIGACRALLLANVVRLLAAFGILKQVISHAHPKIA